MEASDIDVYGSPVGLYNIVILLHCYFVLFVSLKVAITKHVVNINICIFVL